MTSVRITFSPQAEAILNRYAQLPVAIPAAIARGVDEQNEYTVSYIQRDFLSFPKDQPATLAGLRVQTNRLRGSIRATKAVINDDSVFSSIGSNVKYAAAHEFGAVIPPHKITAKNGKALMFIAGGKVFFRRSVNHPGSVLPERAFVRRGLADMLGSYKKRISRNIVAAAQGGNA